MNFNPRIKGINCLSDISKLTIKHKIDRIKYRCKSKRFNTLEEACEWRNNIGRPYYSNITNHSDMYSKHKRITDYRTTNNIKYNSLSVKYPMKRNGISLYKYNLWEEDEDYDY